MVKGGAELRSYSYFNQVFFGLIHITISAQWENQAMTTKQTSKQNHGNRILSGIMY